jgi:hypothetical protein
MVKCSKVEFSTVHFKNFLLSRSKPEHGQPGPNGKWPDPTFYFGPMSQAWAEKSCPIDKTGRA